MDKYSLVRSEYNENMKGLIMLGGRSALISKSQFFICLDGREGERWGGSESPILSFWGLGQIVFPFSHSFEWASQKQHLSSTHR